jgi:hypothetical protein
MRRPIRPFTVETKKGIRRADKAEGTPTPFLELEPEPVAERRRSTPQMKAAQALFDKPAPASAQPGAPEAGARILRSLIDPPTVLPVCDDFPGEAVRPGRKPGSKNKPREGVLPKNRERPLWPDFMTNGDAGGHERVRSRLRAIGHIDRNAAAINQLAPQGPPRARSISAR